MKLVFLQYLNIYNISKLENIWKNQYYQYGLFVKNIITLLFLVVIKISLMIQVYIFNKYNKIDTGLKEFDLFFFDGLNNPDDLIRLTIRRLGA